MTNTDWPSDEDVRKALVALHGHADVFPVHYEQARQALLAGTEGLRDAHDRQIAAKDEAIIALRERTPRFGPDDRHAAAIRALKEPTP